MKKRIISAIIALIIVIPIIILGGTWFYFGAGVIGLLAYYEVITVKETEKKLPVFIKSIVMVSFIILMMSSMSNIYDFTIDYKLLTIILFMSLLPLIMYSDKNKYDVNDAFYLLGASFFLGVSFNFLITIRNLDMYYLFYILIITTMTDTFAHFVGTQIGKHKLCPNISPNKTIEGLIGGTIMGTLIGTVFFLTVFNYMGGTCVVVFVSLFLSLMGQFGDLVFSAIKRKYKVKDFGKIMPGHGGVLDRVDSLLFAILAFAFVIVLL